MRIGYDAKRVFHNATGLGNYSRDLIRIMSAYYPDNQYFLFNPKPPVIDRLEWSGNMQMLMPRSFMDKKLPSLWRAKGVMKDINNLQLDIYHGLSGELPLGIENSKVKSIVTIHDLIFLRYPHLYSYIDRKIYTRKFKKACVVSDKIIAISQQTKKDIIHFFGIEESKIEVVYQGCHQVFKTLYLDNQIESVRKKYNLPAEFVLNVGTIEERKNAFTIVKALKGTEIPLVLVGRKTSYAQQIVHFIENNHMESQVHFLEGLDLKELAILYQAAKVFIYPSIFEGFGIPIIEALFSRTPVITNSKGVFPEAAGPYSTYLDDVMDENEMREKILDVWSRDMSEEIEKSFSFARQFSDIEIAQKLHQLYENV